MSLFGKVLWSSVAGTACSAVAHRSTASSLAVEPPTLDAIMDATRDVVPIRAVIVGGGYSGSRMAYQLDSMFDVTHIDTKNFYELTNDVIPIITNPWDDERNTEACRRMMVLHRYYLKRSNVITGTVDGVDAAQVYLRDGRVVPYDLLFIATGERKPFPFQTAQRTISGRVQELKQFNQFLQKCQKVAVVGGGPVGTSLAQDLATTRPDLEVHLYHQRPELLPQMPGICRRHAHAKLSANPNLHLHLSTRVTDIAAAPSGGGAVAVSSSTAPALAAQLGQWWRRVRRGPAAAVPEQYAVHFETLQHVERPPQSILNQVYFGKQEAVGACGAVQSTGVEAKFDYIFPVMGDTPQPLRAGHRRPNVLQEHEVADGHYRVSSLLQFYGHPNWFAVGRCTNLPVVRGYGASDVESRTLFRELNSVVSNPTTVFLRSQDGVQLSHLQVPRLHVRLGVDDATGCTPWSGGLTGVPAVHEFMLDRSYLLREFLKPIFYKQQDQTKIKQRVLQWMQGEVTSIVDFSHC